MRLRPEIQTAGYRKRLRVTLSRFWGIMKKESGAPLNGDIGFDPLLSTGEIADRVMPGVDA
jgi:hypothetical protein